MTLDEAIKHCEEVAEEKERSAKLHQRPDRGVKGSGKRYLSCLECAEEHRQRAKWLRELKAYREIEEVIFNICKENCEYPKDKPVMCGACWVGTIKDIFENLLDEFREINADDELQ